MREQFLKKAYSRVRDDSQIEIWGPLSASGSKKKLFLQVGEIQRTANCGHPHFYGLARKREREREKETDLKIHEMKEKKTMATPK